MKDEMIIREVQERYDLESGAIVVVIDGDDVRRLSLEPRGERARSLDAAPVPPCAPAICQKYRSEINEICKSEMFPPDRPILIRDNDGLCACYCR